MKCGNMYCLLNSYQIITDCALVETLPRVPMWRVLFKWIEAHAFPYPLSLSLFGFGSHRAIIHAKIVTNTEHSTIWTTFITKTHTNTKTQNLFMLRMHTQVDGVFIFLWPTDDWRPTIDGLRSAIHWLHGTMCTVYSSRCGWFGFYSIYILHSTVYGLHRVEMDNPCTNNCVSVKSCTMQGNTKW